MKNLKFYTINIFLVCFMLTSMNELKSQTSGVLLSNLMVTNHFTGEPEIKRIAVKFDVVGIDSLVMLQIDLAETNEFMDLLTISLNVVHKDGKHFLVFGKDNTLPISGKPQVIFFLDVRDQIKTPYYFIRITGVDAKGLKTNTLVFNKK